ncbi:MAG: hypothetical protein O2800_05855 [Planctomycetota bacterium]|nr:hypothetical protein [Planctomycetota bacterium]
MRLRWLTLVVATFAVFAASAGPPCDLEAIEGTVRAAPNGIRIHETLVDGRVRSGELRSWTTRELSLDAGAVGWTELKDGSAKRILNQLIDLSSGEDRLAASVVAFRLRLDPIAKRGFSTCVKKDGLDQSTVDWVQKTLLDGRTESGANEKTDHSEWVPMTDSERAAVTTKALEHARSLATAAAIVAAPMTSDSLIVLSSLPSDKQIEVARLVESVRNAALEFVGRNRRATDTDVPIVIFLATDAAQASVVRGGAFADNASDIVSVHFTERLVTIIANQSAEAVALKEALASATVSAALQQSVSSVALPPWLVEGVSSQVLSALKISTPQLKLLRQSAVDRIRSDPRFALGALINPNVEGGPRQVIAGGGIVIVAWIERERKGTLPELFALLKKRQDLASALKESTGLTPRQLAEAVASWHKTND